MKTIAAILIVVLAPAVSVTAADGIFRNQVQPILARFGCSTGACHGAAAGKGGFRLSLRGYDDEGDWRAITRHSLGRRITPADPTASLLLLKATNSIAHKGGKRFEVGSREYHVLADWIAGGAAGPDEKDPRIERIEVVPDRATLKPGDAKPFAVKAFFSDGSTHDVTHWAKYTSSDTTVSNVDEFGKVNVVGHGEGAITAWYLSKIAITTVTSPYPNTLAADVFDKAARRNFIDEHVLAKLKTLNLPPSQPCSDSEFLRRAFLDTIGTLPTTDEARAFLADSSPDKRDKMIDSLLQRSEFADYWAYKWSDLLLVNSKNLRPSATWAYYHWIRKHVAANTPWDQFVRQIVTATGSTLENGAANFFVLNDDPTEMAETMSIAFLGMSVTCAKCHNHPMEKWTNDQYYGLANLFARVRGKNIPGDGNIAIFSDAQGELVQPLTGKPQLPRPLDGAATAFDEPGDRRQVLADWLVSPKNPYFSRAIANRVWKNFMGVALVEAVDDLRVTNPASNEALLTALADHLARNKFDLKSLMREILRSQAYQRSSVALKENAGDQRFYARYYSRRLIAEVALDALSQATGTPTKFRAYTGDYDKGPEYPLGMRAVQLPDSYVESYFLKAFGRPERVITCECERVSEPSMAQVLHIANGDTINDKLKAKGNRVEQWLAGKLNDEKIVEDAYLSALSRYPSENERKEMLAILKAATPAEKREAIEDLFWSVLSSKEFLFNH